MENWYQILGVSFEASEDEIKASYRKLAKQYHPDAHPGKSIRSVKDISRKFQRHIVFFQILKNGKNTMTNFISSVRRRQVLL